jgi:hypothetical protein
MRTILICFLLFFSSIAVAQRDTSFFKKLSRDTSMNKMNMDAVYNRPFLQMGSLPVAIGGYLEANTTHSSTDGVSEGFSFQIPRMTIFLSSSISSKIKFLSEIELEEGGREINIEFASMDVEFHPLFNFRGGIIMNPIGSFNQNHDGPKWEFVNRPVSSTTIIPSTWSTAGFGLYGKYARNDWVWAYEAYLTNGFDDKIIANKENKTWLPASKENTERFTENFNGEPLVTLKSAIKNIKIGELGLSWMGGVYNKFEDDGLTFDKKRRVDLLALDFNTKLNSTSTYINGEIVFAWIDVPKTYTQQYGSRQRGGFLDIVQPLLKKKIFGWDNAVLNAALRLDYADYNLGRFSETGGNISEHTKGITGGFSLRPSSQTVFRANYFYQWTKDILGNPFSKTAGVQFGISTYF